MGIDQLKAFLDARPAPPEGASYRFVQEPYSAFLQAISPTAQELAEQRAHPPAALPSFSLCLIGQWSEKARACLLASLQAQTYSRFSISEAGEVLGGDYVLYLWPGDTLAPDALYAYAQGVEAGGDLIYGDEDLRAGPGPFDRCCPFFKSAPSSITQMSFDMLSCGVMVGMDLFRQVGPIAGIGAEARYAYNLRCLLASNRAIHIPRPLYTLAQDRRPSPQGFRALEGCLGPGEALAGGQWPGSFRVEAMEKSKLSAAIIIPCKNEGPALRRLLESLEARTLHPYGPIIIADLGSGDAQTLRYYRLLEKAKAALILYGKAKSLSSILNQAARATSADVLVFLSPQCEALSPTWLDSLLGQLLRRGVGAAGGKLLDGQGRLCFCGGVAGLYGWAGSFYAGAQDNLAHLRQNRFANSIRAVSCLSLACMAIKASVFWNAGGFDESFLHTGMDTALCLQLCRRGYSCVYTPYVPFRLHGTLEDFSSACQQDQRRGYDVLRELLLWGDPHCSPNFDFSQPLPQASPAPQPAILLNPLYGS